MKRDTIIFSISLLLSLLTAGCTGNDIITEGGYDHNDPVGQPVLFTSGNVGATQTRADVIPYMAQNGRFVCTMYYHPIAGDTDASPFDNSLEGTMKTAWLKVNNTVGNSVYRGMDFSTDDNPKKDNGNGTLIDNPAYIAANFDDLGFEKAANIFYWQNRLNHAFLALADYNKLFTNVGATSSMDNTTTPPTSNQGKLKMFPNGETTINDGTTTTYEDGSVNKYDLTKGTRTSISQQPDPILALTVQPPAGATQEANRVRLYFKHQFSQIQVNLKGAGDGSASITASQITKVELLGVSTEGYVTTRLNIDGTVGDVPANSPAGTMNAAWGNKIRQDQFTDEQLAQNLWGTSFEMFDMATGDWDDVDGYEHDDVPDNLKHDKGYALGFVKSYNAIAFGELWAIRITWKENTTNHFEHVTTFEVPVTNERKEPLRDLQSGKKYIYNLELRRGTLAVIRTQIVDWLQKEALVYDDKGTITN